MWKISWLTKEGLKIKSASVKKVFLAYIGRLKKGISRQRLSADELLSPRILRPDNELYICAKKLRGAVKNKDCKNIALTGMYGSGKSSVVRTALRWKRPRKILTISFVNYEEPNDFNVENKIFQHILYKASESRTRKSRIFRISHISNGIIVILAVWFISVVLSVIAILNIQWQILPDYMHSNYATLSEASREVVRWIIHIASIINVLLFGVYIVYKAIQQYSRLHVKSLEAKYVKLELDDSRMLNFEDLLSEILYFLKAGGYSVVVFEDLDRINVSPSVFIKLREINMLLNESSYYQRRHRVIHFIYAIQDDVYQNDLRTKCFDYVLPVVPIVDKNNMGEYLIKLKKTHDSKLAQIDDKDLLRLGTYIPGRRELSNIFNEYVTYRAVVDEKQALTATKFLALIIYKNLCPHDFSLSYRHQGCLCSVFEQKQMFSKSLNQENFAKKQTCEKEIEEVNKELRDQRSAVVNYLINEKSISHLKIGDQMTPIEAFVQNEALFQQLVLGNIKTCVYQDEEIGKYDIDFDVILESINERDFEETHTESLRLLSQKQKEKNDIEQDIAKVRASSLHSMLLQMDGGEAKKIFSQICNEEFKKDPSYEIDDKGKQLLIDRLYELVSTGYISEEYVLYISVPHLGMLTEGETDFLHSVLRREPYHWFDELPNIKTLITHLNADNFSDVSILNYDILNYLLEIKNPSPDESMYLKTFVQTSRNVPDFIIQGESQIRGYKKYLDKLFEHWKECIAEIVKISDSGEQNAMFRLLFIASPEIEFEEADVRTLSTYYGLINTNIKDVDIDRLLKFVKINDIKFTQLEKPKVEIAKRWFESVLRNGSFAITMANLLQIYGEEFNTKALTLIYNEKRVSLKYYLLRNVETILSILPASDVEEEIGVIEEIVRKQDVLEALLEGFVVRQRNRIDLARIEDVSKKKLLLKWNKVNPTWENINDIVDKDGMEAEVISFIRSNVDSLSKSRCEVSEMETIGKTLLLSNEHLALEEYQKLAPVLPMVIKAADLEEEGLALLEESRMQVLIQKRYLEYSKAMNAFIHTHYDSELFANYITVYFTEFENDDDFDEVISNSDGKWILTSSLEISQKRSYLKSCFRLRDAELDRIEYAEAACDIYGASAETIEEDEKPDLLEALSLYPERPNGESWRLKIGLINRLLVDTECSEEDIILLITILGGGYLDLLYSKKMYTELQNNDENRLLLSLLEQKFTKRISRVYDSQDNVGMKRISFRTNSAYKKSEVMNNSDNK